jgi:hypothetical protein
MGLLQESAGSVHELFFRSFRVASPYGIHHLAIVPEVIFAELQHDF